MAKYPPLMKRARWFLSAPGLATALNRTLGESDASTRASVDASWIFRKDE
jgi:hypothetical protein